MNRTILLQLKEWKESNNRKPLILRGARQVGKSWVVNELAAKYYAGQVHVINFEKRTDWKAIFDSCLLYTSPSPRDGLLSRMPSSA